jgi:hypothetical protein
MCDASLYIITDNEVAVLWPPYKLA